MAKEKIWINDVDLYIIKESFVSSDNILSLKKFFEDHKHYRKEEIAKAARKSLITIAKWELKSGIREKRKPYSNKKSPPKRKPIEKVDRSVWDNREWFAQKYAEGYGVGLISKMIGITMKNTYYKMKKYGFDMSNRQHRSTNPCCNEEWLMIHYATPSDYRNWCKKYLKTMQPYGGKCLSVRECAALAGVKKSTIESWLIKFNIPIRDMRQALHFSRRKANGLLKGALDR